MVRAAGENGRGLIHLRCVLSPHRHCSFIHPFIHPFIRPRAVWTLDMDDLTQARREAAETIIGDPLAASTAKPLAKRILARVRDPKMHESIALRAAHAVHAHKLSIDSIRELLDIIDRKRDRLRSPGAYFCASLKKMLLRAGVDWD